VKRSANYVLSIDEISKLVILALGYNDACQTEAYATEEIQQ
jgi:hypothetical protein